jgi:hypothetical protein
MVFPLLVGTLAQSVGIARSYWFCAAAVAGLLAGALAARAASHREDPACQYRRADRGRL